MYLPLRKEQLVTAPGLPISRAVPATWEFDVERILTSAGQARIDITGQPPTLD